MLYLRIKQHFWPLLHLFHIFERLGWFWRWVIAESVRWFVPFFLFLDLIEVQSLLLRLNLTGDHLFSLFWWWTGLFIRIVTSRAIVIRWLINDMRQILILNFSRLDHRRRRFLLLEFVLFHLHILNQTLALLLLLFGYSNFLVKLFQSNHFGFVCLLFGEVLPVLKQSNWVFVFLLVITVHENINVYKKIARVKYNVPENQVLLVQLGFGFCQNSCVKIVRFGCCSFARDIGISRPNLFKHGATENIALTQWF